jgi:hypothetical protein
MLAPVACQLPTPSKAITARKQRQRETLEPSEQRTWRRWRPRGGLDVGADGVAVITIDNPPVNSLPFDGMLLRSDLSLV